MPTHLGLSDLLLSAGIKAEHKNEEMFIIHPLKVKPLVSGMGVKRRHQAGFVDFVVGRCRESLLTGPRLTRVSPHRSD